MYEIAELLRVTGYEDSFGRITLMNEEELNEVIVIDSWLNNNANRMYRSVCDRDGDMRKRAVAIYRAVRKRAH